MDASDYLLMSAAFLVATVVLMTGLTIYPNFSDDVITEVLGGIFLCTALFMGFLVVGAIKRFVK